MLYTNQLRRYLRSMYLRGEHIWSASQQLGGDVNLFWELEQSSSEFRVFGQLVSKEDGGIDLDDEAFHRRIDVDRSIS